MGQTQTPGQGQGSSVKNNSTHGKALAQGIPLWNIKALTFVVQKLITRLKFHREWQNDRQDKISIPPDLQFRGHKNVIRKVTDQTKSVYSDNDILKEMYFRWEPIPIEANQRRLNKFVLKWTRVWQKTKCKRKILLWWNSHSSRVRRSSPKSQR